MEKLTIGQVIRARAESHLPSHLLDEFGHYDLEQILSCTSVTQSAPTAKLEIEQALARYNHFDQPVTFETLLAAGSLSQVAVNELNDALENDYAELCTGY